MGKLLFTFYRIVIFLLLPAIYVRYMLKGIRKPMYRERMMERFGAIPAHTKKGVIWIHAVSVGEVNAALPLVKNLLAVQDRPILMTCVTPTGSAQIKTSLGDQVEHIYAPIDAGVIVRKFLKKLQPCAIVIFETELWPSLIRNGLSQNIPILFANLRLSDNTFRNGKRLQSLSRYTLRGVDAFCVQTSVDSERIVSLGADSARVHTTGNLKFDVKPPSGIRESGRSLREYWGGESRETIILGSSHEGEEILFIKAFERLRERFPRLVCVIVPRHPERFDQVFQMISESGYSVIRRSNWQDDTPESIDVVLVDTMGELIHFYAAADVAVVGGSFVPIGGHNILEPILAGIPPVFGPEMSNFREISRLTLSAQAGRQVQNTRELETVIAAYLDDPKLRNTAAGNGEELLQDNQGALATTLEHLSVIIAERERCSQTTTTSS